MKKPSKITVNIPKSQLHTDTKEANESRAQARAQFGIGRDFKMIVKKNTFDPDVQVIDPAYAASLGVTESDWEDSL